MARFENQRDIRGAWLTGLILTLTFSTLIAIVLIASSSLLVPRLFETEEAHSLFFVFVLSIPLLVSLKIGIGAIRGRENTLYKVLTRDIGYRILRISLIAVLLWYGVGLVGTALGYFVALIVVNAIAYALLNRLLPLWGEFNLHMREMTVFSLPLVVSTVMSVLLTNTDTVMLGYFASSGEVGIYNAAYPLATSLTIILGAFGYLYLPMASRLDSDVDGSVDRVYEVTTKWVFLLVFPIFLTLVTFSDEIISLFFGGDYAVGGAALSILAVGFFTNAAVGRNRETLSALGATNLILVSNTVAFGLNIALNLLLIPVHGFMGAAFASAASFIALNFLVYLFLRSQFGITPFTKKSLRLYVALPLLLGVPGLIVGRYIHGSIPAIVLFGVIAAILTVLVVILVRGFEPEDGALVDFVEDITGIQVPLIRRYIPD